MTKLKNNGKEKNRPTSIDTTTTSTTGDPTWPHLDVLNQIMTPVQILHDNSLQQELDFYTRTQFKFSEPNATTTAAATPAATTPMVTNSNASYFDSLSIPNDQHHQEYNTNQYSNDHNYASLLFNQQQQQPSTSNDGSLLLTHESRPFKPSTQQQQQQQRTLQSLYSNNSTPANSTPTSPIVHFDNNQQNYFDQHENNYNDHTDRFATMFLTSSSNKTTEASSKEKKTTQKFRFKQDKQPLDSQILSKHNLEQDKRSGIKRPKSKQKVAAAVSKKKQAKRYESDDDEDAHHDDRDDQDDNDNDDEEDEPVIGDGALSYSSMGSNSSRASQPLTKDDKRRRNTAASARFRIKKKMREQALQNTACEMTDKAQRMEQRVHELEREIKWLKALVVEKNEVRIEQLVRERPPNSTAFPSAPSNPSFPSASSSSSSTLKTKNYLMMNTNKNHEDYGDYEDQDDDDDDAEEGGENGYHHDQNRNRRRY